MNYEKKYNEALAKARTFYKKWDGVDAYNSSLAISELKEIFPELAESEEEKLRKEMLQIAKESEDSFYMVLTPNKRETLIAWLEKQGQQNSNIIWHDVSEEPEKYRELLCEWYAKGDINYLTPFYDIAFYHRSDKTFWNGKQQIENVIMWAYLDEMYDEYSQSYLMPKSASKPINEEKVDNADNVEPKFKVGDWITDGNSVLRITSMNSGFYQFEDSYDVKAIIDKKYHLWTIKDVKDGNVLYSPGHNLLWIYKDKDTYHVATNLNYSHNISMGGDIVIPSDVCPASKEQCDILFARIKKYGYTWG